MLAQWGAVAEGSSEKCKQRTAVRKKVEPDLRSTRTLVSGRGSEIFFIKPILCLKCSLLFYKHLFHNDCEGNCDYGH